jgi:hypothetical protein
MDTYGQARTATFLPPMAKACCAAEKEARPVARNRHVVSRRASCQACQPDASAALRGQKAGARCTCRSTLNMRPAPARTEKERMLLMASPFTSGTS